MFGIPEHFSCPNNGLELFMSPFMDFKVELNIVHSEKLGKREKSQDDLSR